MSAAELASKDGFWAHYNIVILTDLLTPNNCLCACNCHIYNTKQYIHYQHLTLLHSLYLLLVKYSLPSDVQSASSLTAFRRRLKAHVFQQSYPDIILQ